ncbi:hypothetical protein [Bradyrhizobium sp. LMTR 3]|uniref:hypothetical protein n=1 Tax=Bradyrhizobium sp. LMTR 3 TaxID=189873 RepID=UPI0011474D68|nr:hypothetical protein [Bradyrhizobium sp. LMTR 3]
MSALTLEKSRNAVMVLPAAAANTPAASPAPARPNRNCDSASTPPVNPVRRLRSGLTMPVSSRRVREVSTPFPSSESLPLICDSVRDTSSSSVARILKTSSAISITPLIIKDSIKFGASPLYGIATETPLTAQP